MAGRKRENEGAKKGGERVKNEKQGEEEEARRERRWEDMDRDCLINIFLKIEETELYEGVRIVCKSWNNAYLSAVRFNMIELPSCIDALGLLELACQFQG
ncbi:hypothetical protein AMTRI_Chr07g76090 [Amborella trichopoda]